MEFKKGWWSIDLGNYRPHPEAYSTYSLFSYEMLPEIEIQLKGDFAWLGAGDEEPAERQSIDQIDDNNNNAIQKSLKQLTVKASELRIDLPEEFITLMNSRKLQDRIYSATACYFELSEKIIPSPLEKDAYLIRFYNDQQGCVFWYLYLSPGGDHFIVSSVIFFDDLVKKSDELFYSEYHNAELTKEVIYNNLFFCAPSFEEFIYRFWFENEIWFAIDGDAVTGEHQKYLDHYK